MARTNVDKSLVTETHKGEVTSTTKHRMSLDEYRSRSRAIKNLGHSTLGVTEKSEQLPLSVDKSSTLEFTSISDALPKKK